MVDGVHDHHDLSIEMKPSHRHELVKGRGVGEIQDTSADIDISSPAHSIQLQVSSVC
jgi:hypothetical protein